MDPLSALSVAAGVVQFLEFAAKRCRDVSRIYDSSDTSLITAATFTTTSEDFNDFAVAFKDRKRFTGTGIGPNSQTEIAIDSLVDQCANVAKELVEVFQKLESARRNSLGGLIGKTIVFMKAAMSENDIAVLLDRLEKYQQQLVMHMLFYLNMKADAAKDDQTKRLDAIESKIVKVLTVSEDKLSQIQSQNSDLRRQLNETGSRQILRQDKTLAAILTLQNGNVSFLSQKGTEFPVIEKGNQKVMELQSRENKMTASVGDFKPIQDDVLACLYFRQFGDRYDGVQTAYGKTYSWIFDKPESDAIDQLTLNSSLVEWLETGSGCYWIDGKAGSGKSTLMKYIWQHPKARRALALWARSSSLELVSASFFLWNLGGRLQKTQEGLLRSLLYNILSAHPYLISVIMPELWMAGATRGAGEALSAPSFQELIRWFRRLLDRSTSQFRLFFLIDGIDEYDGDYLELINLITSSTNPHAKFLISSRPIPSCVDAFSRFPGLRLQDLTKRDIRHYVEDHLQEKLEKRHGDEWTLIVEQVVEKSCGVFLWVVLVVRSIMVGLQNFDNFEELCDRLNELPSDLKDLYAHMLKQMQHSYRQQASKLLQMSVLGMEAQRGSHALTPLQLFFSEKDAQKAISNPMKVLTTQEKESFCEEIEGRMRSRCCGLLETRNVQFQMHHGFSSTAVKHQYVEFIHRTVVEFLRISDVWDDLVSLTADTSFHPSANLFYSCLLLCKSLPIQSTINLEDSYLWFLMNRALEYASLAEDDGKPVKSEALSELDKVISHHWENTSQCTFKSKTIDTKGHWTRGFSLVPSAGEYIWAQDLFSKSIPVSYYNLTLYHCLNTFMEEIPPSNNPDPGSGDSKTTELLYHATRCIVDLNPWTSYRRDIMASRCISICTQLLRQGADPNAKLGESSKSAWELMLGYAVRNAQDKPNFQKRFHSPGFVLSYSNTLLLFIRSGADVNATVAWRFEERGHDETEGKYSALVLLEELFAPVDEWDFGTTVSKEQRISLATFQQQLTTIMRERGAMARKWRGSQLVSGPPEIVIGGESAPNASGPRRDHSPGSSSHAQSQSKRNRLRSLWSSLGGSSRG